MKMRLILNDARSRVEGSRDKADEFGARVRWNVWRWGTRLRDVTQ